MATYERSAVLDACAELQALDADWAIRSLYVNNTIDAGGYLRDVIIDLDTPGHSPRWVAKWYLLDVCHLDLQEFTIVRQITVDQVDDADGSVFVCCFSGDGSTRIRSRDCRLEAGPV